MDPSSATTLERAAESAFVWAERLPLPPRLRLPVLGALGAVVVALVLARKLRGAKIEKAPPPVSDGGTREDEDRRALVPPDITQPIPTREQGNSEGNG